MPRCCTLGTKDGSRMDVSASEVGTVCILRVGVGLAAELREKEGEKREVFLFPGGGFKVFIT